LQVLGLCDNLVLQKIGRIHSYFTSTIEWRRKLVLLIKVSPPYFEFCFSVCKITAFTFAEPKNFFSVQWANVIVTIRETEDLLDNAVISVIDEWVPPSLARNSNV